IGAKVAPSFRGDSHEIASKAEDSCTSADHRAIHRNRGKRKKEERVTQTDTYKEREIGSEGKHMDRGERAHLDQAILRDNQSGPLELLEKEALSFIDLMGPFFKKAH
ncbi:hypothetical protein HAX54_049472, partial [Datura stramonium]|nr:hypothetical protein [Datura stramonium]